MELSTDQRIEYWQQHVKQMLDSKGSQRQYAEQNGLNLSQLCYYRDKFKKKTKFAKVVVSENKPEIKKVVDNLTAYPQGLPDPKWLSQLIRELLR